MERSYLRLDPIELVSGVDSTITIPLYTGAYQSLDPTGYTASWTLRRGVTRNARKPFSGSAVLTKTEISGVTLATGTATIAIADTDLASNSGEFWQSLVLTDGSGNKIHAGQGRVLLRAALP